MDGATRSAASRPSPRSGRRCAGRRPRTGGCRAPCSVAKARPSATWVARPRSRSGGFTRKPITLISGSTSQPGEALEHDRRERLRRLAGVAGQAGDPQHVAADGGGQHVGHELAGQAVVDTSRRSPACRPSTSSTRCQRTAESTSADERERHGHARASATVRASSSGMTSSRSIGGMRQIRTPSISALRPMRSTSDTACFRFNRPLSPSLDRWSIVDAPTGGSDRVGTLGASGRSAGRPGPAPARTTSRNPWEGPCSASSHRCWSRRSCSSAACADGGRRRRRRGEAPATPP